MLRKVLSVLLKIVLWGVLILLNLGVLVLAALTFDSLTYKILEIVSSGPDQSHPARVLPPVTDGYRVGFEGGFPPKSCDAWINGEGRVQRFTDVGSFHAGSFELSEGNLTHITGFDPLFDGEPKNKRYNNVVLFCALPTPNEGQKLTIEMYMDIENLIGSTGFYIESPAIDAGGGINKGGFQAVGLSVGGSAIEAKIAQGAHLHEVWGWAPIQGKKIEGAEFSGLYVFKLWVKDGRQYASLSKDGIQAGTIRLKHPLRGPIEVQVWLDNYSTPLWFWPIGHANIDPAEVLTYSGVDVRLENIR